MELNNSAYWRMSSVSPTIFGIPCLSYCPIFIFLLHIRVWTLILSILVIGFSGILVKYGYTFSVFIRKISSIIRGNKISQRPWWFIERFRGY